MILRNAVPDGVPNSTYTQLPQKKLPRCGNTKRDRNGDKYMEDFQSRQTTTGLSPAEHNLEWPEYVARRVGLNCGSGGGFPTTSVRKHPEQ